MFEKAYSGRNFSPSNSENGRTEHNEIATECVLKCIYSMQDRCTARLYFRLFFDLHTQYEFVQSESPWYSLVLFFSNFTVGDLQLSVENCNFLSFPKLFSPRRCWLCAVAPPAFHTSLGNDRQKIY